MKTENIDSIVIHCSDTPYMQDVKAADIDKFHKKKGWKMIGYNYVIDRDGTIEVGRPLTMDGAHCNTCGVSGRPYNKHSIGICYIGGRDKDGKYADTRTDAQKVSISHLIYDILLPKFPNIVEIIGHRDASPDKDGNGVITKDEHIKACPCFDVRPEFPIAICTATRK